MSDVLSERNELPCLLQAEERPGVQIWNGRDRELVRIAHERLHSLVPVEQEEEEEQQQDEEEDEEEVVETEQESSEWETMDDEDAEAEDA